MVRFETSPLAGAEIMPLFLKEFQLCRVQEGEKVVLLTEPSTNPAYVSAAFGAALALGAEPVTVTVPAVPAARTPRAGSEANARMEPYQHVFDLMKQVDFVVDLSVKGMLHSERQFEILNAGTRMLRIREPIEILRRLFPVPETKERVLAGAEVLKKANVLHVSADNGMDFTVEKGDRPVFVQYGYAEKPGRWDHWGTSILAVAPLEHTARGTIVLSPGDALLFGGSGGRYVTAPVYIHVEDATITRIEGGAEARILQRFFEEANEEDATRISHIGWSCDRRAQWTALERYRSYQAGGAEMRSVYGIVLMAFGSNADLLGANRGSAHMDLGIRFARFAVDDRLVLDNGEFTLPELR